MLIAVRHGQTSMNDGAGGPEKFRGWLPVPLTLEGMKAARDSAQLLGDVEDIKALYSSDVVRAVQSATEVGQVIEMPIEPAIELRDWNLGDYVGKPVTDVLDEVLAHIDEPTKPVRGGESYQTFLDRTIPFLQALVESDDLTVAVTHARDIGLLMALAKNNGKYPDTAMLKQKAPIHNSGMIAIGKNWDVVYKYMGQDPSRPLGHSGS